MKKDELKEFLSGKKNLADQYNDVMTMWSDFDSNEYIQLVVFDLKTQTPNIMLYNDEMIAEMRSIMGSESANPSILHIDKVQMLYFIYKLILCLLEVQYFSHTWPD